MTDHQLYISVGVPFFSLILVWLGTSVSNRSVILGVRSSIDDLRKSLDDTRVALAMRIDDTKASINLRIDDTNQRIGRMEGKLDSIDTEIRTGHERRLAMLEATVFKRAG
jgi:hypothetical protein